MSEVRDHLSQLISLMVDQPDQLEIDEGEEDGSTKLDLRVAEEDLGKVIGRQGRTARALRCLLTARETRLGDRYDLEIVD